MASVAPPARPRAAAVPHRRVVDCYDFLDRLLPESGLLDMTDGMYQGDPAVQYEQAQRNQIEWLLDEARCARGSRILDLGCGNGTLLAAARQRGAEAVGITISPPQIERCRKVGLDVRLLDYRNIGDDWTGRFDAVIANGSIEHFVQADDVIAGRADAVYRELFEICRRILDPASSSRRFVTTVIHTRDGLTQPTSDDVRRGSFSFRQGDWRIHYWLLQRGFGGFYPLPGQLARCAAAWFAVEREVDGTEDYRLTSEEWLRRARSAMLHWQTGQQIWPRLLAYLARRPGQGAMLCTCLFIARSWQWQFRGENPPVRLLRQTWAATC